MARTEDAPPAPRLAERRNEPVAIAAAGFHRASAERLIAGAESRLIEAGHEGQRPVHWVPGAFELPLAAQTLAETGEVAAVIAVGAVIRGQTAHFDYICQATALGLSRVSLDTGVPCAFGVLTCDTVDQAMARSGGEVGNAGEAAVDAAVSLINLIGAAEG